MDENGERVGEKRSISATVDDDKVNRIDALVLQGKYRNRSHAIEEGMRLILEKEESNDNKG